MGLLIKTNKKGEYQLTSSVTDGRIHDKKWISEDEAKRILIHRHFLDFVNKSIEIDMTFPNGFSVDGKHHNDENKPDYNRFILDTLKSDKYHETLRDKFEELHKRLELQIKI